MQDELPTSSMYSIRKSKKYSNLDKTGDLGDNKQSAINSLNASVIDFYCKDEYSRLMPGKKDFKSVKVDGKRIHIQKRLMLMNLKELYNEFRTHHSELKVGFSKFASLRPQQCVLAGSSGTHSVCVCLIHQNVKLMCESVFKKDHDNQNYFDYHTWLNLGICKNPLAACYMGDCNKCPGFERLRSVIHNFFDGHNIETVSYNLWTQTDRSNLMTKLESVEDFIDNFLERLPKLLKHSFITKQQNIYFNKIRADLKSDEVLVVLDFAENYTFVIQNEVQSYHWTNEQATIHPFGIYYRSEEEVKFTNFVIISDIMKHNTIAVNLFLNKFVSFIKEHVNMPSKVFYFSDGSAAQYKNKSNIYNLTCHEQKYGIKAEWNYFCTAHRKNVCDGLGGTLKRLVARASIQSTGSAINTPFAMYTWSKNNIKNMNFIYVSQEEYIREELQFNASCPQLKPVPKTQAIHHVNPLCIGKIQTRYFSLSSEFKTYSVIK